MNKQNLVVVIPCYNESKSLLSGRYIDFIKTLSEGIITIIFVDDKSTDETFKLLSNLAAQTPSSIHVIQNKINVGKAESIRNGMIYAFQNLDFDHVAFLDADLATPLSECVRLTTFMNDTFDMVFGSRILRIGADIKRNYFRYITGRVVATLISTSLRLDIYDTQCGCKVFKKNVAETLFKDSFISKWLFDVELCFRAKKVNTDKSKKYNGILEVPLDTWIEYGDSKVSKWYFLKLFVDLYKINKKYNWS